MSDSGPQVGIVTFPGSNGDHDALWAFQQVLAVDTRLVDYRESTLDGLDLVVLPGGFSFGDYLRCGAIARFTPVMEAVARFAAAGGTVLGICNGFQILTEAHLLPGALVRNQTLRFHCHWTHIKLDQSAVAPWLQDLPREAVLRLPVAHGDGSYAIDPAGLAALHAGGQVVAKYCDPDGSISAAANNNGSIDSVAAVCNREGNVVGLMPHPERAVEHALGGADGADLLRAVLTHVGFETKLPAVVPPGSSRMRA